MTALHLRTTYARDDHGGGLADAAPRIGQVNSIGTCALDGDSLLLRWIHDRA